MLQPHPAAQAALPGVQPRGLLLAARLVLQKIVPAEGLPLAPAVLSGWLRPGLGLGLAEAPAVMPGSLQDRQQDA